MAKQRESTNNMDIEQTFNLEWGRKRYAMLEILRILCGSHDAQCFSSSSVVEEETKFTKQYVLDNINSDLDLEKICLEPFATIDFALEYIDKMQKSIGEYEIVERNKIDELVEQCKKMHREIWTANQYRKIDRFIEYLSASPNITMNDIENCKKIHWNWSGIAKNPNLTFDFILKHFDTFFSTLGATATMLLSKHPCITTDIMNENRIFGWNFANFSLNPNITKEFILQHPDKMRSFTKYSENPKLTIENVLTIPIKWDWEEVSKNAGITMYDVKNNPDKPWVFKCVLQNPNLTFDFIENNVEKIKTLVALSNEPTGIRYYDKHIPPDGIFLHFHSHSLKFDVERNAFFETRWKELLLISIHEYYNNPNVCNSITFTSLERILFDTYLAKQLTRF